MQSLIFFVQSLNQKKHILHFSNITAASAAMPKSAKSKAPAIIGIISDTHGLLRDEAVRTLRGSDLIIHAGLTKC
jgi:hypothetical protein